jgi:hypothetical protein
MPPAVFRASDYPPPPVSTLENTARFRLDPHRREPPDMPVGLSSLDKPIRAEFYRSNSPLTTPVSILGRGIQPEICTPWWKVASETLNGCSRHHGSKDSQG